MWEFGFRHCASIGRQWACLGFISAAMLCHVLDVLVCAAVVVGYIGGVLGRRVSFLEGLRRVAGFVNSRHPRVYPVNHPIDECASFDDKCIR